MASIPSGGGAAATTPKSVPGPTGHTTVLQLQGIEYRISLFYLGKKRVQHGAGYHTNFALQRGKDPNPNDPDANDVPALTEIGNTIVATREPDDPLFFDAGASKPLSEGGDNSGPMFDEDYRVVIHDYHGMRDDDSWPGDLLGSGANNVSKPQNYGTRNFDEDIFPDVPFRVVVRKYLAGLPLDLQPNELSNLRVAWEIKDTGERLDHVSDTGQKSFLEDFVEQHRNDPNKVGDDNCKDTFRGLRPAGQAGVSPPAVLFAAPYRPQPPVDRPAAGGGGGGAGGGGAAANPLEDVLSHAEAIANPVDTVSPQRGVTELTSATEPFGPGGQLVVGVSDVIFRPYPASGDNYRFLLTLTDAAGTDVRQLRINMDDNYVPAPAAGAAPPPGTLPLKLRAGNQFLPFPCCYTTGVFTIWRRIHMRMLVFTNSIAPPAPGGGGGGAPPAGGPPLNTLINWNDVRDRYHEAFVEITGAETEYHLDQDGWRNLLQSYFRSAGTGVSVAQINNNANYTGYLTSYFPPFLQLPPAGYRVGLSDRWTEWQWEHLEDLTVRAIRDACNDEGINPRPRRSSRQLNSLGFYIFLHRRILPVGGVPAPNPPGGIVPNVVLGMYVGEQQFCMVDDATTVTLTHELGHGLYLRHGNTARIRRLAGAVAPTTYVPSAGANINGIAVYSLREGDGNGVFHLDHDQADFNRCIMSYGNDAVPTDFCAVCLLTLRYYDRVRLANNERPRITGGWDPVQICELTGGNLNEAVSNLTRGGGNRLLVVAVAKIEADPNDRGRTARLVNTAPSANLTVTPAATGLRCVRGADNNHWVVTATNATPTGTYTLNLNYNGSVRATRTFDIV